MTITLKFDTANVDWQEVATVIERAPLGTKDPERLRRAFENTHTVVFAYDGEKLVGLGRAISDGEYYSAIFDMVVLPEYQGQGIGKKMVSAIHERIPKETIILFAAIGKEPFYRTCGYSKLLTGMGRFRDASRRRKAGFIE
jgi:GNAT superfamily N-acetyltransferase